MQLSWSCRNSRVSPGYVHYATLRKLTQLRSNGSAAAESRRIFTPWNVNHVRRRLSSGVRARLPIRNGKWNLDDSLVSLFVGLYITHHLAEGQRLNTSPDLLEKHFIPGVVRCTICCSLHRSRRRSRTTAGRIDQLPSSLLARHALCGAGSHAHAIQQ